jgi:hemolysin activation/secretion protein
LCFKALNRGGEYAMGSDAAAADFGRLCDIVTGTLVPDAGFRSGLAAAAVLMGMALPVGAAAQAVLPPSTALPTRQELQRDALATAPKAPRLRIKDEIEAAPCALDNPSYAKIRVTVTKASFGHLGSIDAAALTESYADYLGTDQPISVVCRIRDAVATRLRAMGYIAAVEVPVQRIANGEVAFEVLYARVRAVHVVGQVGPSAKLFEAYLQGLVGEGPFNRFAAERLVLLARDMPGYDVQLTLKPAGTGAGDMIAEVRLSRKPVEMNFSLTDLAAPATGRFGAQAQVRFNDLLGLGDRTTLGVYSTTTFRKQQIYQLGEEIRIGGRGLKLAGRLTYALTRPELGPDLPVVHASTVYANGELSYPLVLRTGHSLISAVGVDVVDQNVNITGAALSRDRVRIAYGRVDFSAVDLAGTGPAGSVGWRLAGDVELRRGIDVLGSTPNCVVQLALCTSAGYVPPSIPRSNPAATVLRVHGAGDWHPLRDVVFSLDARGQWASGSTVAFEQMALGNFTAGRGYNPGALTGDSGIAFQAEAKLAPFRLNSTSSVTLAPYAFTDSGWLWTRSSGNLGPSELHSLGVGVRFEFKGATRLDASIAEPLTRLPGASRVNDPLLLLAFSTGL